MSKNSKSIILVCLSLILCVGGGLVGLLLSRGQDVVAHDNSALLGCVEDGKFQLLWPEKSMLGSVRLTDIQMQEARSPESGELNLSKYEGQAIMVSGHGGGGGWVYDARIVDAAGPILTLLVLERFQ